MIRTPLAAVLAISGIAALSACSGGGGGYASQPSRISYAAPQPTALSPEMIQQVQSRLQQAGTYHGRIDGQWGPGTEAAVRSYQQQHNLNPTGQLDGNTLAALNLDGGRQNYGNAQPSVNVQPYGNADAAPATSPGPSGSPTQLSAAPPR